MNSTPNDSTIDAKKALAARGFGTFKRWARANRKGAAHHRQQGNRALLDALDVEYEKLIRPNL